MPDGWTCRLCNQRLTTSSNSAHSVAFDWEILNHVTAHECTCTNEEVKCDRCQLRAGWM